MTTPSANPSHPATKRLPLGRSNRRLSFERRVRLWLTGLAMPPVLLVYFMAASTFVSRGLGLLCAAAMALGYTVAAGLLFDQLIRPLQTLSNVVSALREDDFSFRARGARRGDSLGDLALEINALAGTLQHQRSSALDALTLVERVLTSMQSPVLAFDEAGKLRLINAAARESFGLGGGQRVISPDKALLGRGAAELGLAELLQAPDQGVYPPQRAGTLARWSVRRAAFRLHGLPHTLFVLSDVAAALREEERTAWQRLIRVLSHEINNSLTPIKSIAGSLRGRLPLDNEQAAIPLADLRRGLAVIEDRSASLNRFLQAYQQLTRLPAPSLRATDIARLLAQVTALETRLPVTLVAGPPLTILADPDQLTQALINLLRNAVEAATSPDTPADLAAQVSVTWSIKADNVVLQIEDNGPGITNPSNLFVPFYTTKATGSGIGLVLAQQIAGAHGGTVTLHTEPGRHGCTALLTLPIRRMA